MKSFKVVSLTILFVVSLLKNSVPDITNNHVTLKFTEPDLNAPQYRFTFLRRLSGLRKVYRYD